MLLSTVLYPKGPPQNLRPITLLNTIRKALSIITLHRIRPHVEKYLSPSQSGFRPDRSTADVVWTHKWLAVKTNAENVKIKITGIDIFAAFDTIDRKALLDILKTIIDKDEVRIICFLLSNTVVNTKVNEATEEKPFISNVVTPQGDGLSPVLFIIYLEHALRDIRTNISSPTDIERLLPREVAYADDVHFVSLEFVKVEQVQKALERHRLFVNVDKTDFTTLSRNAKDWREIKKVGSLIGGKEDVERRKQLSTAALLKLRNIWIGDNNGKGSPRKSEKQPRCPGRRTRTRKVIGQVIP
ncbi:very-long-chain enoyl-CoA reductase [Elysia marginata]|uniref:Very-long-chain enoyl-CoA reductase n=1 Tax=Elysia marginata TaxID=1093978 RepID=A0AAV4G0K9_9GAST|nr:very-long-chain enoyl-CoA reductase [Elysia marginata]